jgi:phosphatidylcholine synthase
MRPEPTHTNGITSEPAVSPVRIGLAWGVHLLTASGAVIATVALIAIGNGDLGVAAVLMLVALAIDSGDGTLARAVGVTRALPWIDGRRLDDMVDFLNYVIVPAVFMVAAGSLPHWSFAALPVLASCYGFSHVAAKTDDDFFLGFPSYWNVVAIYAWGLGLSPAAGGAVVGFLSLMVFVPMKYAYPSKLPLAQRTLTAVLGVLWSVALAVCVLAPERVRPFHLLEISLAFPAYYLALSFWLSSRKRDAP